MGDVSNDYDKKGIWADKRQFPIYQFFGNKLNLKTLSKESSCLYPIYTKWSWSKEAYVESGNYTTNTN